MDPALQQRFNKVITAKNELVSKAVGLDKAQEELAKAREELAAAIAANNAEATAVGEEITKSLKI